MLKRVALVFFFLLIVTVAAFVGLNYWYNSMLEPVDPAATEENITVEIPSGTSTETIAEILYEEGLIQNGYAFRFYVHRRDYSLDFIAGEYQFNPAMSTEEIVNKIRTGDVYVENVWFTIPEGYWIELIAERLKEKGLIDQEKFLALAREPSSEIKEEFPFLKEIDDPDIKYELEGYLYPDTYEINADADEKEIIKLMLRRMDNIIDEQYKERMEEMEMSLHEVLTLAAMVEREARVDHERDRIAGVMYNRLDIDQRLEIDATIQYILGEPEESLTYDHLEVKSPYNTYQNAGLPPGPIAAPGEPSIEAVLYPEDTDYYYYNYKYDDSGEHFFSETHAEHMQNVRRAQQNREEQENMPDH
ncbi:MAG: endolytic transglycosylase MltG [Bacillota bacterium]